MKLLSHIGLAFALAAGSGLSQAAIVSAGLNALGGNIWRVAITVQNDGTPASIPGLTVYFDESLFGTLSNATAPAGWDLLLFQPDAGILSAPGAFDALAQGSAFEVMAGQTLSGFGVDVVYLGTGTPGPMAYEIYALVGAFAVTLGSGTTVAPTAAVPEPMTAWLVALGLAGCAVTRRSAALRHGSRA